MIIGVPKEIKDNEYRVSLTPGGARLLTEAGNQVLVEREAGEGSGFAGDQYGANGAEIIDDHASVFQRADMVLKVKEPLPVEYELLRPGLLLFTYLHLAADEKLTREMVRRQVTGVAYETVELPNGHLPLLIPMSQIAGQMSIQVAAHYLEKASGGRGKLLGGVPGVRPSTVVIIGGGTVGTNAARVALGMGGHVIVIHKDLERLSYLSEILQGNLTTLSSNPLNIAEAVKRADVVIGGVLIKGGRAPKLVTREMIHTMEPGSVIVDVCVDQGGCVETSHPTTHADPVFIVEGVIHYCVANMPGAVPRTSTYALSNATLPYAARLANLGFAEAVKRDSALAKGVNTYAGHITYPAVAECFGMEYRPVEELV